MEDEWFHWESQVPQPSLSGQGPAVNPTTDRGLALLAADTDRTQEYVFASARLPEIRGGSLLLRHLNEEQTPALIKAKAPEADIIYAGGGSLLALIPAEKAEDIQQEIKDLYLRETGAATITCVVQTVPGIGLELNQGYPTVLPLEKLNTLRDALPPQAWQRILAAYDNPEPTLTPENFTKHRGFGQWVQVMGLLLRRAKESKERAHFQEALPFAERCQSCRVRPTERLDPDPGGPWARCGPCRIKYNQGTDKQRTYWCDEFTRTLEEQTPALYKAYYGPLSPGEVQMPRTLADLGEACQGRRKGYIGFIYADGDGVGGFFEHLPTIEDYREKSHQLEQAIRLATFRALARLLRPIWVTDAETGERKRIHPFEIITIGGDDVLLIVPADVALPLGWLISRLFEEHAPGNLTLSVGVSIADAHTPVRFLRDLAADLLKNGAKPLSKRHHQAAVDFHLLKAQAMFGGDISETRRHSPYRIKVAGEQLLLLDRPYPRPRLVHLLRALLDLEAANLAPGQLYALAEALPRGRHPATLFYLYRWSRMNESAQQAFVRLERAWELDENLDPFPWHRTERMGQKVYRTMLLDMAELYDFVPLGERGQRLRKVLLEEVEQ